MLGGEAVELIEEAANLVLRNLTELHMLTGKTFEPVETTEFATMRGVMQASYYRCKRCGMLVPGFSDTVGTYKPLYCSKCGAKAVK